MKLSHVCIFFAYTSLDPEYWRGTHLVARIKSRRQFTGETLPAPAPLATGDNKCKTGGLRMITTDGASDPYSAW